MPPLVLRSLGMLGDRRESLGDAEGGGAELALGPHLVLGVRGAPGPHLKQRKIIKSISSIIYKYYL